MKINKMNYPIVDSHNRMTGETTHYIVELDREEARFLLHALEDLWYAPKENPEDKGMQELKYYLEKEFKDA